MICGSQADIPQSHSEGHALAVLGRCLGRGNEGAGPRSAQGIPMKTREFNGKPVGKPWENVGKSWENDGKSLKDRKFLAGNVEHHPQAKAGG